VIAYTVSQQTHEIGIRMALGAAPVHVLRLVGFMGMRLVAAGAVIGLLGSFAATRLIAAELFSTSRHDPLTLTAVVITITVVGLAVCYFPARRATRVDPLIALRG
jgi:putative ABC transport system permease protein